jgi:colanic acid biosynthesis glycosyl transferase WcaI
MMPAIPSKVSNLRLSLYSYNYAPEPTGIPYYNTQACAWLAGRLGWQVTVNTGIPHYPWWRVPDSHAGRDFRHGRGDEVLDGVTVRRVPHYIPAPPVGGGKRMRLDLSWLLATAWRSLFDKRRPQVLVMVAPPFLGGLLGWWLRLRWRVPVVYHVQDLQVDAALELGMLPRGLGTVLLAIERRILLSMDVVSTVSRGMRDRIRSKVDDERPVTLWPNWTDTSAMREGSRDNTLRRALCPDASRVLVLYSGNLGRKQGLEVLLEAAAALKGDARLHFVIVGDGAERGRLETEAQRLGCTNLAFHPLVPQERLAELLAAADIHLIPQRREAADLVMPSKLLNILACARPVVVTADPGTELADTVIRAGCGLVVPPGDAAALAAAITRLAEDAAERQRLGAAGRAHACAHLDIHPVMARCAARVALTVRRRRLRP